MLLEVYRCVQLKRWSVVCGCVLQRGQRGEGWCVSSTLCRYDIRMGLLLVLNWARVRRVSLGLVCHESFTSLPIPFSILNHLFILFMPPDICFINGTSALLILNVSTLFIFRYFGYSYIIIILLQGPYQYQLRNRVSIPPSILVY